MLVHKTAKVRLTVAKIYGTIRVTYGCGME